MPGVEQNSAVPEHQVEDPLQGQGDNGTVDDKPGREGSDAVGARHNIRNGQIDEIGDDGDQRQKVVAPGKQVGPEQQQAIATDKVPGEVFWGHTEVTTQIDDLEETGGQPEDGNKWQIRRERGEGDIILVSVVPGGSATKLVPDIGNNTKDP